MAGTDEELRPSRLEAERDEFENRPPKKPILLGRYRCIDPWCPHAEWPHSHGKPGT